MKETLFSFHFILHPSYFILPMSRTLAAGGSDLSDYAGSRSVKTAPPDAEFDAESVPPWSVATR